MNDTVARSEEAVIGFGSLPEGWALEPVRKYLRRKRSVVGDRSHELTLLSLTLRGVIVRDLTGMKGKFPASFDTYQDVHEGDMVFCLFDVEETPRTVGCARTRGMITGAYDVFECADPVTRTFLLKLFTSLDDRKGLAPLYRGLRKTIPRNSLMSLRVPVPPASDLVSIVRYLDHAELRIAKAIAGKMRLASLLAEQLASLKEFWFLHGGDSDRLGKVHGLEHLGMVSTSASARPAGLMFKEVRRPPLPDIPKLSLSLTRGLVRSDSISQKGAALSSSLKYSMTCEGDLVLNKYRAYLGAFAATSENGLITPNYTVLAPGVELDSRFYANLFSTHTFQALWLSKSKGVGDGMMPLYTNEFRRTHVPWFPVEIQKQLVTSFEKSARSTQQAIDRVVREIALLKEYRTRLISDVVTGKIDIREEAAKLTDIDPAELAGVLAGGTAAVDEEEAADGDD